MSRQEGYGNAAAQGRALVSSMDTDLDRPNRDGPPSPPPLRLASVPKYRQPAADADEDSESNGALKARSEYGEAPQTPYYDYACNSASSCLDADDLLCVDEKSKMHVDTKQYSVTQGHKEKEQTVPSSPSNSMHSVINLPSRPQTSQHMSPGHALPTGMANLEKSEHMPEIQMPSLATLDPYYRLADQDYTSIAPTVRNPFNEADLQNAITDDIVLIYKGVQHCLDLRRKYIRISLQRSHDNPKNNVDHWKIYPEPPRPRWTYNSDDGSWQDHKHDLPKLSIGEDFDVSEIPIPGPHHNIFRMENGVYQVYPYEDGNNPQPRTPPLVCSRVND
jgi:hypothetical protein